MEISRDKLVEKAKKYKFAPIILAIFTIAVGLRYYPVRNIQYLQALDPYNLFRMSQQIAYTGSLPELDFMRYFPYAMPLYEAHIGNLVIPAVLYWLGGSFFFDNYLEFAYLMMPLFAGLASITMYFLGKELYDKYTGLGAAFFIAILPGAMFRSSAGFFEKEATGTFLMLVSLLFFTIAWKRTSWIHGIISGLALGLFTITWGGSQMMWLLYPMIAGFMILIDQDIKNLIAAYTPTIIIAPAVASIFNPGRFWFTDTQSLLAIGFLTLLWARYLAQELEIISKNKLPYFGISSYIAGGTVLALSPFYSNTIAQIMLSIYSSATQTGAGTIGETVQENAAPSLYQIVTQLGSGAVDQLFAGAQLITALTGAWTFTFLAIPLMTSTAILMVAKRYSIIESLTGKQNYSLIAGIIGSWAAGFVVFFEGHRLYGLVLSIIFSIAALVIVYYLDEESAFNISMMGLGFTAVITTMFAFGQQDSSAVLRAVSYPLWIATTALVLIDYLQAFEPKEISLDWYKIIPLFWLGTNILAASARTRLIYLAAFPAALGAGYTLSLVINKIKTIDLSKLQIKTENARFILSALLIAGVISVNLLAGWASAQGISGSPNEAWMDNLEYLEEEAPEGSVVMSWWDYGYHFQSIGRTGTVADGGNFGYYTDDWSNNRINFPLAEYLSSTSTEEHDEFLEKHSVDYIVLDNTMINKYAAVSQIAEQDNEDYDRMSHLSTLDEFSRPIATEQAISRTEDRSVVTFRGQIEQRFAEVHVPINEEPPTANIAEPATIRFATGEEEQITCALTDEGVQEFGEGESQYCVATDPYYSVERGLQFEMESRIVVLERELAETTFAKLYLMDGYDIPYAERVDEGSNGFIEMWEVE